MLSIEPPSEELNSKLGRGVDFCWDFTPCIVPSIVAAPLRRQSDFKAKIFQNCIRSIYLGKGNVNIGQNTGFVTREAGHIKRLSPIVVGQGLGDVLCPQAVGSEQKLLSL